MRNMVVAIRTATVTTVRVTNHRRNGSTFVNSVTLSPVHDSDGVYRYSIGVLSDAAKVISEGPSLEKLRSVLPRSMQADAQPLAIDPSLHKVDAEAQSKQYRAATVAFTRLRWSMGWESALLQLLSSESGLVGFGSWLQREAPEDLAHLDLLTGTSQLDRLPAHKRQQHLTTQAREFAEQ